MHCTTRFPVSERAVTTPAILSSTEPGSSVCRDRTCLGMPSICALYMSEGLRTQCAGMWGESGTIQPNNSTTSLQHPKHTLPHSKQAEGLLCGVPQPSDMDVGDCKAVDMPGLSSTCCNRLPIVPPELLSPAQLDLLLPLPSHGASLSCTSQTSFCEAPVYHRTNGTNPSGTAPAWLPCVSSPARLPLLLQLP